MMGFDGTFVTAQVRELIEKHHVGNWYVVSGYEVGGLLHVQPIDDISRVHDSKTLA
jgi:hypothetical protein